MSQLAPFTISEVFVFIVNENGVEGVPAFSAGALMTPLIAADERRLTSLRPIAQAKASRIGKPLSLCRFSVREVIETISPA